MLILLVGRRCVELAEERREAFRLLSLMLGDPRPILSDENAAPVMARVMHFLGEVAKLFEDAATVGVLSDGDARQRTVLYWLAIHGAVQADKLSRFGDTLFDPTTLAPQMARSLLLGWGAPAPQLLESERWLRETRF